MKKETANNERRMMVWREVLDETKTTLVRQFWTCMIDIYVVYTWWDDYDETIKDVRNALFANKTHKISLPRAAVVQAQAKQYNLPTMYDPNVFFLVWGSG